MMSGSTSSRPSGFALISSRDCAHRSSSISRCLRRGIEVATIDDAIELEDLLCDILKFVVSCSPPSCPTACVIRPNRSRLLLSQSASKPYERLFMLHQLERLAREPTSLAIDPSSSSKTSQQPTLQKISGMKSLYFGASSAPRSDTPHPRSRIREICRCCYL